MSIYYITENEHFVEDPIEPGMLGTQFVTTFDFEFVQDEGLVETLQSTGATTLRYPGGSVTENAYADSVFLTGDWNASVATSGDTSMPITPMDEFFEVAAEVGAAVQLVLPTRVAFEQSAAEALLNGSFGARHELLEDYFNYLAQYLNQAEQLAGVHGVEISGLEIGNEFWGSGQMSASEYGYLSGLISNYLAENFPEHNQFMQIVYSSNFFSPANDTTVYLEPLPTGGFSVHDSALVGENPPAHWVSTTIPAVGNGHTNNQEIADAFLEANGDVSNLNGLISHVYFGRGLDGTDGNHDFALRTAYDRFVDMIGAENDLDYVISEWGPRGPESSGLQYAHSVIEAFFELSSNGIDAANFWPTTFGNPNTVGRTLVDTVDRELTFGGVAFSWLTSMVGLRPSFDFEIANEIDIHGYTDSTRMVFLVSERSGLVNSTQRTIDFENFSTSEQYFVTVSGMTADDGSISDDRASPLVSSEGGFMISGNTISLNLAPWELSIVEFHAVTDSSDQIFGTVGQDRIIGSGGDDFLAGGEGADVLNGEEDNDTVHGEAGDDFIRGGWGHDSLDGGDGDDTILGGQGNDVIVGGDGDDWISAGEANDTVRYESGGDLVELGDGDDVVNLGGDMVFSSGWFAMNVSSDLQTGTNRLVSLEGLTRIEAVTNGGTGFDVVGLTNRSDAFFLHDSFSDFYDSILLSEDQLGQLSAARFSGIEEIRGMGGNDVIDLTSPDYSLDGVQLTIDGGSGNDVIWGSDADETVMGGLGDDTIFGGSGDNVLFGGGGADTFEFTLSSNGDIVEDFSLYQGDRLIFYNSGGIVFDLASVTWEAGTMTIGYTETVSFRTGQVEIELNSAETLEENDILAVIEIL